MSSLTPASETLDPHAADAITRVERRRAKLERMSEVGMDLVEEIRGRTVGASSEPEPRHDPFRGFALVSRAVRLTLAFETRIDVDILAMRKGEPMSWERPRATRRSAASDESTIIARPARPLGPDGIRLRDAARSAINAEFASWDPAVDALDALHERLTEYEIQERFADLPWRECVETICADLGFIPNWTLWSDETGFRAPAGKPDVKWDMLWTYDPKRSEQRRRRQAERPPPSPLWGGSTREASGVGESGSSP